MMVAHKEGEMDKKLGYDKPEPLVIDVEAREKPSALRAFLALPPQPKWMDHWAYKLWAVVFLTYHGLKYAGVIEG